MPHINQSIEHYLKDKNLNVITSLNLSNKNLDKIPSLVFDCKNLEKLNISHNKLSSIPKEIQTLKKLKVLNLSYNKLTYIPAPICRLPKLKTLDISHNNIKSFPKQLSSSNIINLIASNNKLDVIDYSLIVNIVKLIVNHNELKNFAPHIKLPLLKYLWIKNNPCTLNEEKDFNITNLPNIRKIYPTTLKSKVVPLQNQDFLEGPSASIMKNKIFISYSHDDEKWLKILKVHLKSLQNIVGGFEYWDDKKLRSGDRWKDEIEKSLNSAVAAIIIITPSFLASDFIINNELPPILEKAQKEGTHIFPVLARKSIFTNTKLSVFQSVNPPEKPLNACSEADVDEYLNKLMEDLIDKLELNP